jgi:hypothetical protein
MSYLYGDSTDSPFTSNVLELVRDAIDLSVYLLDADGRIRAGRDRMEALRQAIASIVDRLAASGQLAKRWTTQQATDWFWSNAHDVGCDEVARAIGENIRAQLAEGTKRAKEEESAERDGCIDALMKLLVPHRPPDSSIILRVRLRETGSYDAWVEGSYPGVGLTWKCELGFPAGHLFSRA